MLSSLIGFLGDFDRAEEAAQDAFAQAAERWPRDGVPRYPAAWLVATARHRAIDGLRRERTYAEKLTELDVPAAHEDPPIARSAAGRAGRGGTSSPTRRCASGERSQS